MTRRYTLTPVQDLFWKKVRKSGPDDCWEWIAYIKPNGYGQFQARRKRVYAHRYSWEIHNGEIPEGLRVCHKCDNPKCVNPSHLFLGTAKDNSGDMVRKNRHSYGERNGQSRLTSDQAMAIYSADGTLFEVARRFGVSFQHVSDIKNQRRWRSLHE